MTELSFAAQLPELQRELAIALQRVKALQTLIDGIRLYGGDLAVGEFQGQQFAVGPRPTFGPRGSEGVMRLLAERPGHIWPLIEIKRELLARGWAPSPKSVDANMKRLLKRKLVDNPRYGFYRLPGEENA